MTTRIRRVLIANRGEIAVRIAKACRERAVVPLHVFSEADRNALHVQQAETACCIGGAPAAESYLNAAALLNAAKQMNADAVHPGYGFLSENSHFARLCQEAGLTWIGPSPETMEQLGDKARARKMLAPLGVPVPPGFAEENPSLEELQKAAENLGAPLLIKAAAGGGGRGMRVVTDLKDLEEALHNAKTEAKAAFGDDRVLLERFLQRPRHIEIQIFGDAAGRVIALGERECSLQRRHQKIVEESPSPAVSPELRQKMSETACLIGRAAQYQNAGTVEFLLECKPGTEPAYYFLEVNTRLQVEHPVTELVTGLDLVHLQLDIAEGASLPAHLPDCFVPNGHALEVRLYAEDPEHAFLPSVGKLECCHMPVSPGIRIDSGVAAGSEISPWYDPQMAKIIAYAPNRSLAVRRMLQALCETQVAGVATNQAFLLDLLAHPEFEAGNLSIHFLNDHFPRWSAAAVPPEGALLALAAVLQKHSAVPGAAQPAEQQQNPWLYSENWCNVRIN